MCRVFSIMFLTLSLIGATALCVNQTLASETSDLEKQARLLDKMAQQEGQSDVVYTRLSEQLGVDVATLKTQQQTYNASFGNLFIANALAKSTATSTPPISAEAFLQQFKDGQGWGVIAKQNGTKLGPIISQLKRSSEAMEHAQNQNREEQGASAGQHNRERNENAESRGQQERTRSSTATQGRGTRGRSGR